MAKKRDEETATTRAGEAEPEEQGIVVAEGEWKSFPENGAEARFSDERHQSSFVGRWKTKNRELMKLDGRAGYLVFVPKGGAEQTRRVVVTVDAEDVGGLPRSAEVVGEEEGGE